MSRTRRPLRAPRAVGVPLSALLLILIAGAWNAPAAGANEVVRHLEHRAVLAPETLVELENLAGRIEILPAAGNEMELRATVHAGSEALADHLRFDVQQRNGKLTVDLGYPIRKHTAYVYPGLYPATAFGFLAPLRTRYHDEPVTIHPQPRGRAILLWADLSLALPAGTRARIRTAAGTIAAERVAGDLRLDTTNGAVTVRDGEGSLEIDTGSGSVEVHSHRGAIVADTGSGAVRLTDIEGDIRADTGSGAVRLSGIAGNVRVDTGSGSVRLTDVAGDVRADTGSGAIELERVTGALALDTGSGGIRGRALVVRDEVVADTGSGSVLLEGDFSAVRRLVVDTGSGRATLRFAGELPALSCEIYAGSGGIDVALPGFQTRRSSRGHLTGTIADGSAGTARIKTGSGGITIQPAG